MNFSGGLLRWKKQSKNSTQEFGRPKFGSQNSVQNSGSGGAKSRVQTFVENWHFHIAKKTILSKQESIRREYMRANRESIRESRPTKVVGFPSWNPTENWHFHSLEPKVFTVLGHLLRIRMHETLLIVCVGFTGASGQGEDVHGKVSGLPFRGLSF